MIKSSNSLNPNWKYERDSEASVVGSYFAEAVAVIATKQYDFVKRKATPKRIVFWDEPRFNPPLRNSHISAGFDAHITEERLYWSRKGKRFPPELPQPSREKDKGPKKPVEFPKIFESPVKTFERNPEFKPFQKVFKSSRIYNKVNYLIKICFMIFF